MSAPSLTANEDYQSLLQRVQKISLQVGGGAALLCVLGALLTPEQFYPAYLVGYLYWWSITLGCLSIALLQRLTGGGWGMVLRRLLESATATLPLMALLFLPILLGMNELYVWSVPEVREVDHLIQRKADYLNVQGFQLRALIYFALWLLFGLLMNRWSARETDHVHDTWRHRLIALGGPGLIVYVLTVTLASVDWVMSLEPHWFSSMYGVLHVGGNAVSGMSFVVLCAILLQRFGPWKEHVTVERWHDMGNLMLAFVMFWAYVNYMQFLIIWGANLPEETPWYVYRLAGGWQWVGLLLAVLHFILPFLLLLSRDMKRDPSGLQKVVCILLVMRLVDLIWLVMPSFTPAHLSFNWVVPVAPVAVGGLWLATFTRSLLHRAPIPVYELSEETQQKEAEDE